MKNKTVKILVATMSGTAELMAEEVAATLKAKAIPAQILMMNEVGVDDLRDSDVVICSSTYGTGEVPDNGKPLHEALKTRRPDLHGVLYGVVGLGDSIYPNTFCFGAKQFDELFTELGAVRVGERLEHDRRSSVYPEDAATTWVQNWLAAYQVEAEAALVPSGQDA